MKVKCERESVKVKVCKCENESFKVKVWNYEKLSEKVWKWKTIHITLSLYNIFKIDINTFDEDDPFTYHPFICNNILVKGLLIIIIITIIFIIDNSTSVLFFSNWTKLDKTTFIKKGKCHTRFISILLVLFAIIITQKIIIILIISDDS